jgi:hypothetical protein
MRNLLIVSIVSLLVGAAIGRYSVDTPKIVKTDQIVEQEKKDTTTHTQTKTEEVKEPTGEVKTVTTTDTVTETKTADSKQEKDSAVTTPQKHGTLNLSALAGVRIDNPTIPLYGISVTKEFLGPVTIGLFGMSNGIVGVSIGLNF